MRKKISLLILGTGVGTIALGIFLSITNFVFPWPLIFILGIVLSFSAVLIYALYSDEPQKTQRGQR